MSPVRSFAAHAALAAVAALAACHHTGTGDGVDAGSAALHSDPGHTACGASSCMSYPQMPNDSPNQPFCCVIGPSTGDPTVATCADGNLGVCESGIPFYCDEAADCGAGLRCCEAFRGFACQASCGSGHQLCQTDAECDNHLPCTPYVCDGEPLATCGPLTAQEQSGWSCTPR